VDVEQPELLHLPLRAAWPIFADELSEALEADGHSGLAAQVDELRIVDRCPCADDFCQSFYTAPRPDGAYGPGHTNIVLDPPWPGYLILDVVNDKIMFVEVLYRAPLA
jgi:hypothetical protein